MNIFTDIENELKQLAGKQQQLVTNRKRGANLTNFGTEPTSNDRLRMGKFSDASQPVDAPWNKMPDGGYPFMQPGVINTPAITGGPPYTWTDVINKQVPNGYAGVVKRLMCNYNGQGFVNGSGQLIWRILINGQAVRNYDSILIQLGNDGITGITDGIRFSSNDTYQFQVTNVGLLAGTTQILCFLGGWFYPSKL